MIALVILLIISGFLSSAAAIFCIVISIPVSVVEVKEVSLERHEIVEARPRPQAAEVRQDPEIAHTPVETLSATIILSFVGDCTLGENFGASSERSFSAFYSMTSPEYFFGGVSQVFASDDLTIINLEGALTDSEVKHDKPEPGAKYWFKGPPEYAKILSAGHVEIANLANNHAKDFGEEGYSDTKGALTAEGIEYFGGEDVLVREVRGVKIGFFGLSASAGSGLIKERILALKREGARVVIGSFHGGLSEITYTPIESQIKAARAAIDNGADFVVEHHPHVIQGIEEYKNGVIAYSLGNFCFGGHSNPEDKDTMIFQVILTKKGERISSAYHVIPAMISSHDDYNDYRPRVLSDGEAISVRAKILKLSTEAVASSVGLRQREN
jgi:poly-gamma-glutamate synthesis protein (capsule biosynthesis protein)